MARVYFQGDRAAAVGVAQRLVRLLTGQEHDPLGVVNGVFLTIGFAALSDIKADFVTKARGGTGEDGVKWPPLSPAYLAYGRRFGPGEQKVLKGATGLGRGHRHAPGGNKGLLTAHQLKRWKRIFAQSLHRLLLSMAEPDAKVRAAQIAWATLKREGARTKLEVFGHRQVEILRDTGVLLNSLSPGKLSQSGNATIYSPPSGDGGDEQIMQATGNGVIVGTTVAYAGAHQYGVPAKGLPARPFLPDPNRIPALWKERWSAVAERAIQRAARTLFEQPL